MLQRGAKKVYCVDVGKSELNYKIRNDERVEVFENINAKYKINLNFDYLDIIVVDVSFISVVKIIRQLKNLLSKDTILIILIKPQFESEKKEIKRGGVIKDHNIHKRICKDYEEWFVSECKMQVLGITQSPLKGPKGNIEFLIYAKKNN